MSQILRLWSAHDDNIKSPALFYSTCLIASEWPSKTPWPKIIQASYSAVGLKLIIIGLEFSPPTINLFSFGLPPLTDLQQWRAFESSVLDAPKF